jgi:hypothetical protein
MSDVSGPTEWSGSPTGGQDTPERDFPVPEPMYARQSQEPPPRLLAQWAAVPGDIADGSHS